MARVVSYVFDRLFERKETVSYREKSTVVIIFAVLIVTTLVVLFLI
jgi:hypothetical protein